MKIRLNGIETNYVIEGNGPWLTMSHSLASNLTMWDEQAQLLSKKFKVLRYDTRGHGRAARRRARTRSISSRTTCMRCLQRSASNRRIGWGCRWAG